MNDTILRTRRLDIERTKIMTSSVKSRQSRYCRLGCRNHCDQARHVTTNNKMAPQHCHNNKEPTRGTKMVLSFTDGFSSFSEFPLGLKKTPMEVSRQARRHARFSSVRRRLLGTNYYPDKIVVSSAFLTHSQYIHNTEQKSQKLPTEYTCTAQAVTLSPNIQNL
jgi:hypothetical protein